MLPLLAWHIHLCSLCIWMATTTLSFSFLAFSVWFSRLALFCSAIGHSSCLLSQSQWQIYSVQRVIPLYPPILKCFSDSVGCVILLAFFSCRYLDVSLFGPIMFIAVFSLLKFSLTLLRLLLLVYIVSFLSVDFVPFFYCGRCVLGDYTYDFSHARQALYHELDPLCKLLRFWIYASPLLASIRYLPHQH